MKFLSVPGGLVDPPNDDILYSQSTGFVPISHLVTTVCSNDPPDALRTRSEAPLLLTPSRWNHAVTALLLPGHGRAPECERAKHRFCPCVR